MRPSDSRHHRPAEGGGGIRSFVALLLPAEVRAALAKASAELGEGTRTVKWVEEKNIHLTVAFLGEISGEMARAAGEALAGAAAASAPFALRLEGLGAFPSPRRPRVLWAGVVEGGEEVTALARGVVEALTDLGLTLDRRRFSPHVTLGRVRPPGAVPPLICRRLESVGFSSPSFPVEAVHLMKSRLTPSGPIYHPLKEARLGGGGGAPPSAAG